MSWLLVCWCYFTLSWYQYQGPILLLIYFCQKITSPLCMTSLKNILYTTSNDIIAGNGCHYKNLTWKLLNEICYCFCKKIKGHLGLMSSLSSWFVAWTKSFVCKNAYLGRVSVSRMVNWFPFFNTSYKLGLTYKIPSGPQVSRIKQYIKSVWRGTSVYFAQRLGIFSMW